MARYTVRRKYSKLNIEAKYLKRVVKHRSFWRKFIDWLKNLFRRIS